MRITSLSDLRPDHYVTYYASHDNEPASRRVATITCIEDHRLYITVTYPREYQGLISDFYQSPYDEAFTTAEEIYELYPEDFI